MCGRPWINSVFGISLQKSVLIIGIIELVITIIATVLNVIKYSRGYDRRECEEVDVCIGPLIKYSVFDALFGVVCSLMLIIGAKTRNVCLLISWMIVTLVASFKYIWVVVTHDWTNLEDWISITYLLFYILVFVVVWSYYREISTVPVNYLNPPAANTVILQQTFIPAQPQQTYPPPQPYPSQQQPYPPQQQPYAQQGYPNQPPPYNPNY